MATHNAAITRALDFAAEHLGDNEWCEGKAITLADLALLSALIYLELRQPERNWRAQLPGLAAFFKRMKDRPSVATALAG